MSSRPRHKRSRFPVSHKWRWPPACHPHWPGWCRRCCAGMLELRWARYGHSHNQMDALFLTEGIYVIKATLVYLKFENNVVRGLSWWKGGMEENSAPLIWNLKPFWFLNKKKSVSDFTWDWLPGRPLINIVVDWVICCWSSWAADGNCGDAPFTVKGLRCVVYQVVPINSSRICIKVTFLLQWNLDLREKSVSPILSLK